MTEKEPTSYDSWILTHDPGVGRFEVWFPNYRGPDTLKQPPDFIEITAGGVTEILKSPASWSEKSLGTDRESLLISSGSALPDGVKTTSCRAASTGRYRWFRLWREQTRKLALIGLSVALLGLVINVSLEIAGTASTWNPGEPVVIGLKIASSLMEGIGLLVVFYGAYIQD